MVAPAISSDAADWENQALVHATAWSGRRLPFAPAARSALRSIQQHSDRVEVLLRTGEQRSDIFERGVRSELP